MGVASLDQGHPANVMTLTKYIERRLGKTAGEQALNFLGRPFGADTLAGFWRYWNPVWSYYLSYFCYRPLRSRVPRPLAVWLTFLFCGVVHDLPFVVGTFLVGGRGRSFTLTVFFGLTGSLVLLAERVRISFARLPMGARWCTHSAALLACYRTALLLTTTYAQ